MTENEQKEAFALALLNNPDDAFKAACIVFGNDTSAALKASTFWVNDAQVIEYQDKLIAEHGEETFLPSKHEASRVAWRMATDETRGTKDRVAALALFSELQGYITKGAKVSIDNSDNRQVNNNVMQVPMPASFEQWQENARRQQAQLIENARSKAH
jgi:hypothetical protein